MNNTNLFYEINLPSPMSDDELLEQIIKHKLGVASARNQLINRNLRLVVFIAKKYISTCDNFKIKFEDLVMTGIIGLIKGIDTYKIDKNVKLATYISKCIDNEILMYLRKTKKIIPSISLEETFDEDNENKKLRLIDTIRDDKDFVEEIIKDYEYIKIRAIVKELDDIDRKIIEMVYGFVDDKIYTQEEIAAEFGVSQPSISRKIKKITRSLKKKLNSKNINY